MEKSEFIANCKNIKSSRKHIATKSFGTYDFYKKYRKEAKNIKNENISYKTFSNIISAVNQGIANTLAAGTSIN